MMVQFIFMTIAFVIMLIVALIQQRTNKRLMNRLEEVETKGWRKVYGFGKVISTRRRFIVIENAGDNASHANIYELLGIRKTLRLMVA